MRVDELEYDLPPALIAQRPQPRRDESRLLVYERVSGSVDHRTFAELPDVIGDALAVVNDTRVVPARIPIDRPRGEVLLLERLDGDGLWEGLARATRRLRPGQQYGPVELLEHLGEGRWRLRLRGEPAGQTPLPPYITEPLEDPERYQTVYAAKGGSAAAPGGPRPRVPLPGPPPSGVRPGSRCPCRRGPPRSGRSRSRISRSTGST